MPESLLSPSRETCETWVPSSLTKSACHHTNCFTCIDKSLQLFCRKPRWACNPAAGRSFPFRSYVESVVAGGIHGHPQCSSAVSGRANHAASDIDRLRSRCPRPHQPKLWQAGAPGCVSSTLMFNEQTRMYWSPSRDREARRCIGVQRTTIAKTGEMAWSTEAPWSGNFSLLILPSRRCLCSVFSWSVPPRFSPRRRPFWDTPSALSVLGVWFGVVVAKVEMTTRTAPTRPRSGEGLKEATTNTGKAKMK